jgi:hypothetical protein
VLCHCSNCQKFSGSAFMHNHRYTEAEITFQRGKELVKEYVDRETKSGNELRRAFCSECVSTIILLE